MQFRPGTRAMTILLAAMTAIGPLSTDIYLASLPNIAQVFEASTGSVQLTLSLYLVGFAIGQIFYGPFSDKFGRRPMLLAGFALFLAATCACIFANSIGMLILGRVVQALGAAGPIIIARAIVRDLFVGARAGRQLAVMSTIMGVMPIGAPVLGGFLQAAFGWRSSFVAIGSIGLILGSAALLFLPETNKHRHDGPISVGSILGSFAIVLRNRAFVSYLLLQAFSYNGLFAFISGSSYVLQNVYGLTAIQFGFTFAICSMCFVTGTSIGVRLVRKRGLDGMISLGVTFLLIGGLGQTIDYLLFPEYFFALTIPQMCFFLGMGFMLPQTMAAAMTPFPERAGAASSLMGFVQMASASIVSALMAAAFAGAAWPLVIVMAGSGVGAFAVFHLTAQARPAATRGF